MTKKFWPTQPVAIGEDSLGIVCDKKEDVLKEKTQLPDGLEWKFVDDLEMLVDFLKFNYVSSPNNDISLCYSKEMFQRLFEMPNHKKEYSLGIFLENNIIGYIFAKEHILVAEEEKELIISINFLCLRKTHRNKFLAPLLIKEMKRIAYEKGIYRAIFTNAENKGFGFTQTSYYHMPLNIQKLKETIYIPSTCQDFNIEMRKNTRIAKKEDFDQIYELYKKETKNYFLYEDFSRNLLELTLTTIDNVLYTIFNDSGEFASFFIVDTFCWEKMISIKKAYMYYWSGSENIIKDAFAFAKNINVDMFDVLDLGKNELEIIEKLKMLEGTGTIVYHLFNWKQPLRARSRVNFILF